MEVGAAKTVARASRATRVTARASSLAREIDLLDGLVTATAARRTAIAAGGKTIHTGRVTGLTLEGAASATSRGTAPTCSPTPRASPSTAARPPSR